jgi:hypothetical protein
MKHQVLRVMLPMLLFTILANGARQSTTPAATLSVSCDPCQVGQAVAFYGTGYKAGSQVEVDIQGPSSYSIVTTVDSNGNISVDYGTTLTYASGGYLVTASAISGKRLIPQTSTSFTVE